MKQSNFMELIKICFSFHVRRRENASSSVATGWWQPRLRQNHIVPFCLHKWPSTTFPWPFYVPSGNCLHRWIFKATPLGPHLIYLREPGVGELIRLNLNYFRIFKQTNSKQIWNLKNSALSVWISVLNPNF